MLDFLNEVYLRRKLCWILDEGVKRCALFNAIPISPVAGVPWLPAYPPGDTSGACCAEAEPWTGRGPGRCSPLWPSHRICIGMSFPAFLYDPPHARPTAASSIQVAQSRESRAMKALTLRGVDGIYVKRQIIP